MPRKNEVVTFKADEALLDAMRGVVNRSEFIRSAVLQALDSVCPVCKGSGIISPNQKRHWNAFAHDHKLKECADCHEFSLVCARPGGPRQRVHGAQRP